MVHDIVKGVAFHLFYGSVLMAYKCQIPKQKRITNCSFDGRVTLLMFPCLLQRNMGLVLLQ